MVFFSVCEVHEVPGTTVQLQTEQIKACKMCCRVSLICPLHHHGTCQSGLEDLEGRRHDDIRRQVIPYPDGNWKKALNSLSQYDD